ncbi:hypothetical protein [Hirschia litorea]
MSSQTLPQFLLFAAGTVFGGLVAFFTWGMLSPGDPSAAFLPTIVPHQDKFLHFIAFGMMAFPAGIVLPRRYLGFVLMSLVALAAGMEFAQDASRLGRQSSWVDFLASSLGALVACAFLLLCRRAYGRKRDKQTISAAE